MRFLSLTLLRSAVAFSFWISCTNIVPDLNQEDFENDGGNNTPTKSFATNVTPILNSKCGVVCHRPGGTAPNPDLNTTGSALYNTVKPIASTLLTATSTSHPAGAGTFVPAQADKDTLTTWVSEGALDN